MACSDSKQLTENTHYMIAEIKRKMEKTNVKNSRFKPQPIVPPQV